LRNPGRFPAGLKNGPISILRGSDFPAPGEAHEAADYPISAPEHRKDALSAPGAGEKNEPAVRRTGKTNAAQ
jgi:hypothetical protein